MELKTKDELAEVIEKLRCDDSPVGMDAVYVHAAILDQLARIEERLARVEAQLAEPGGE